MTCQHFHHLVVADMRSFENGGKHCQGFQLALAVHHHGGYGSVRVQPSLCWGGYHAAAIVAAIHSGGKPHMVIGVRLSVHRHHGAGGLIVEQQTIDGNGGLKQHPVGGAVRWIFPIRVHQQRSSTQQGGQKPK